jgi:pimeloyl-ACP methyl ester carboxylesterase
MLPLVKPPTWLPIVIAFLVVDGFAYEQFWERYERARFPQIGRSVNIGGRTLNIHCSGEGMPTVVFETGRGMPGFSWLLVQPEVAKFTRACWYDRAGYGWSDSAPSPHRSDAIAKDLHQLLQVAGIDPPYVLVGHSFGGLNVRMYYELYPAEVAGMVLVDPSYEDLETIPYANLGTPSFRLPKTLFPATLLMARTLGPLGAFRLLAPPPGVPPPGITVEVWAALWNLHWQAKTQVARIQEGPETTDFELLRRAGSLRNLPLIVVTAGKLPLTSDSAEVKSLEERIKLLAQLAQKSTRGRQVVVTDSGHLIPYEAPHSIIGAIRQILAEVPSPCDERQDQKNDCAKTTRVARVVSRADRS